jgi:DNA-binding NarL/FixJ family response regulator
MTSTAARILCIEDDAETAALIAEDLEERGYRVTIALDGAAGYEAIRTIAPDLVLCDVSMPGMTGFEVLERLTAIAPRFDAMPFLFLTALVDRPSELKGRRLGADDYVTKPIDFEILATIIEARLGRVGRNEVLARVADLNERETECLRLAARGRTSAEIAGDLGIGKRTVDFHIENACRKLGATTRIEAVAKATSGRLISL